MPDADREKKCIAFSVISSFFSVSKDTIHQSNLNLIRKALLNLISSPNPIAREGLKLDHIEWPAIIMSFPVTRS
jgi:hypothetical protein